MSRMSARPSKVIVIKAPARRGFGPRERPVSGAGRPQPPPGPGSAGRLSAIESVPQAAFALCPLNWCGIPHFPERPLAVHGTLSPRPQLIVCHALITTVPRCPPSEDGVLVLALLLPTGRPRAVRLTVERRQTQAQILVWLLLAV